MTTLYHEIVWNWDAPRADLEHAWQIGAQLDAEYDSRGRTQDYYWEPAAPTPGGGLFTVRRVWTDQAALEECIARIIDMRNSDPIIAEVISVPEIHNDNNYNPPA
jgi:hypothetical protein